MIPNLIQSEKQDFVALDREIEQFQKQWIREGTFFQRIYRQPFLERALGCIPCDARRIPLPSMVESMLGGELYEVLEVDRRMIEGGYSFALAYLLQCRIVNDCFLIKSFREVGGVYDFRDPETMRRFSSHFFEKENVDEYLRARYPPHARAWVVGSCDEVERIMSLAAPAEKV